MGPLAALALAMGSWQSTAHAAALSEPPTVIYGKVIQQGAGAAYQLYQGNLTLTFVNDTNPSNRIVKQVTLQPTGAASEFSYRIELPVKYLPSPDELGENLSVGFAPTSYRVESIQINNQPASPLDSAEAVFSTSFAGRAGQHRLDLLVSLPADDTDGDGIPDWWEDLHGLNRLSPTDALADNDGDGLSNLEEFKLGTDPNSSNTDPTLLTPSILVPAGGVAGLNLSIVDTDTDPSLLQLSYGADLPGLVFMRGTNMLSAGNTFNYAEVLSGSITMEVAPSFAGGEVQLTIQDLGSGGATVPADLDIDVFSPMHQHGTRPALWLDAGMLSGSPVSEWLDGSGNSRDGYQPAAASQPTVTGDAVDFEGQSYLYLDDRGLALTRFTAFLAFDLNGLGAEDQTLLNTSDLNIEVGGTTNSAEAQRLVVSQPDRTIVGPLVGAGIGSQLTLVGGATRSSLNFGGLSLFFDQPAQNFLPVSFATLGGSQTILQSTAEQLFGGRIREVLIYDQSLAPGDRTRNEDYQRSRWGSLVVWDYRDQTTPLNVTGSVDSPNALNGGWGDDHLTGGPFDDVLRGGPGSDTLTGGPGADHFEFEAETASDVITDYSPQEYDVIDLSDIFRDRAGDPMNFVSLRNVVVRGADNTPRVNTMLDLNYDGVGTDVDQTITLANVTLSQDELPLLVSKGLIRLGGPRYPATDTALSFADWKAIQYPGQNPEGLATSDSDGDGLLGIFEYIYGTNPHEFNNRNGLPFSSQVVDGHLEIHLVTPEGLQGVALGLEVSDDFLTWSNADDQFDVRFDYLGADRVRRVYRSKQPMDPASTRQFFRLSAAEIPAVP